MNEYVVVDGEGFLITEPEKEYYLDHNYIYWCPEDGNFYLTDGVSLSDLPELVF